MKKIKFILSLLILNALSGLTVYGQGIINNFQVSQMHTPGKTVVDEILVEFDISDLTTFSSFVLQLKEYETSPMVEEKNFQLQSENGKYFLLEGQNRYPIKEGKVFLIVPVRDQLTEPYRLFNFYGITTGRQKADEHQFILNY